MASRFIRVAVFVRIPLLFKTEYFIVCVCHICSSMYRTMDTWLFPSLGYCEYCCYINIGIQSWLLNCNYSVIIIIVTTIITVANVYWVLSVRRDMILNALYILTHLIPKQLHELVIIITLVFQGRKRKPREFGYPTWGCRARCGRITQDPGSVLPCGAFNQSAACLRGTSGLHRNVTGIGLSGLPQQLEPPTFIYFNYWASGFSFEHWCL